MLTQPVLVARLSTHAWALGKGPALFSLRHRDGGENCGKAGSCRRTVCVCARVCVLGYVPSLRGWGYLRCMGRGRWCFCLIMKWTHCLSLYSISFSTLCLSLSLPLLLPACQASGGLLSMVLKVSSHILCMSFLEFQAPIPVRPSLLFKSNVFSLSRQKACQHLAVHLKRVKPIIQDVSKKLQVTQRALSEAVRTNAFFLCVCFCLQHVSSQLGSSYITTRSVAWLNESCFVCAGIYSI